MPRLSYRAAVAAAMLSLVPAAEAAAARQAETIPGRYVVVYDGSLEDPTAETFRRERRDGFRSELRFERAVKGFAARLTAEQVRRLKADPAVDLVVPDRRVRASAPLAAGETTPTGVRRIQAVTAAAARGASTVNVAVIDTGIDLDHPDLTVARGRNCVTAGVAPDDDNGHGTHVAGTIAARNTGSGVVGVAPGTRLFAAKVLDAAGSGTMSQVICGIDWVTGTRTDANPANDIAVANMSLGGTGTPVAPCSTTTDPQHRAICRSVAAGVTYVVAAGNSGWDFDYPSAPDTPAAYPQVLTVTAAADSDGIAGATGGAPGCRTSEADDRYASFSSFALTSAGAAHTTAAPGVCILSTWRGGGHRTVSGTSMATPHVAGLVALCLGEAGAPGPCAGMTPAQVVARMRSDAAAINEANPWFGFAGDPLRRAGNRHFGFLQPATAAPVRPATRVTAAPASATVTTGALHSGTASSLAADDSAFFRVSSTTSGARATSWYATFTGVPPTPGDLKVTYKGANSRTCTQTLSIYNYARAAWVTLDQRSVGTTQVLIPDLGVGEAPSELRSAAGQLRVRVRCATMSGSFTASGNLLRIAYTQPTA